MNHTKALEAASRAVYLTDAYDGTEAAAEVSFNPATPHDGDCTNSPYSCFRCHGDECRQMAHAAIRAFLDNLEVSDSVIAGVQRSEEWSSFWSPDDTKELCRAMLTQLRKEIG